MLELAIASAVVIGVLMGFWFARLLERAVPGPNAPAPEKIVHGLRRLNTRLPLTWCGEPYLELPRGEEVGEAPWVTCPHCLSAEHLGYLNGDPEL